MGLSRSIKCVNLKNFLCLLQNATLFTVYAVYVTAKIALGSDDLNIFTQVGGGLDLPIERKMKKNGQEKALAKTMNGKTFLGSK